MKTAATLIAAGMLLTVAGTATAFAGPRNFLGFDHDPRFDGTTWCASGFSATEGMRDCAFFSLEQCRASVSGLGGICYPSPYAATYDDGPRQKRKRAHRNRHY
jgi:hypothetical protein